VLAGIAGSQLFNALTSLVITKSGSAEQARGVKTTLISAGRFKTVGSEYAPLSQEDRATLQDRVDAVALEGFGTAIEKRNALSAQIQVRSPDLNDCLRRLIGASSHIVSDETLSQAVPADLQLHLKCVPLTRLADLLNNSLRQFYDK
jgi:hypothetical protein